MTAKTFKPLTEREKSLTDEVMNIAIHIHRNIGPGLLETVYEKCFCYELSKRNIPFKRQQPVKLYYDTLVIEEGLKIDLLIDDLVIIKFKSEEEYYPVWESQLLSSLRLTGKRLGYILNFNAPLMKDGVKRMIL